MAAEPILCNDFHRQWEDTGTEVLEAVRKVGASGWYILGKQVAAFEQALAAFVRREYAVGCASGLDAIEIGLRVLGLQPGQRVLTTPLSAFATTLAVLRCGGVPVFVDVEETGLIDLDLVEQELRRDPAIRFLLPVHLYGQAIDLDRLEAIQQRTGVMIVEDMAQAIGAQSGARQVGSIGQVSATSFYPTKNLGALGDGGALFTDDAALDKLSRALRDYGQSSKYVHDHRGLNSRLDEVHAAVLNEVFLPRLRAWTARRCEIARRYLNGIRNPAVRPLPEPPRSTSIWHLFPVLVRAGQRESFVLHLERAGVRSAVHYPKLIPDQGALAGVDFALRGEMKRARTIADGEVSLPIHPYVTDSEAQRVIDSVNSWRSA